MLGLELIYDDGKRQISPERQYMVLGHPSGNEHLQGGFKLPSSAYSSATVGGVQIATAEILFPIDWAVTKSSLYVHNSGSSSIRTEYLPGQSRPKWVITCIWGDRLKNEYFIIRSPNPVPPSGFGLSVMNSNGSPNFSNNEEKYISVLGRYNTSFTDADGGKFIGTYQGLSRTGKKLAFNSSCPSFVHVNGVSAGVRYFNLVIETIGSASLGNIQQGFLLLNSSMNSWSYPGREGTFRYYATHTVMDVTGIPVVQL